MIKKKLSIIIPVYNEEKTIITTIKKIKETKDDRSLERARYDKF